ncbi:MAG TPA: hypothetical protein VG842_04555, partial [Sediminibacterium sp.]|nr:hypothetical protein [Sediminibacterium sp.]
GLVLAPVEMMLYMDRCDSSGVGGSINKPGPIKDQTPAGVSASLRFFHRTIPLQRHVGLVLAPVEMMLYMG